MKQIKERLHKFFKFIVKGFDFKRTLVCCCISIMSFALIFPAGSLFSGTVLETCADYYAELSKNHTINVGNKKLSGLVVEPADGKDSKMRRDTDRAITELWGVFKGENASFAPVKNANHDSNIRFTNSDYSENNLSVVYTYDGQSSIEYHKDENDKAIDYKFQCSPIALMFESHLDGITKEHHIYISQAQAERKLRDEGCVNINNETLKTLLGKHTSITMNEKVYDCIIDNIYLDNFKHSYKHSNYDYYYATDIGTVIGDFVFFILTHIDKEIAFPTEIKDQSLYIMSEYSFRNKFYIKYAIESYSPDNYSFNYVKTNLIGGFKPNNKILNKALNEAKSNIWCIILTVLFFAFFACDCVLIFLKKMFKQPLSLVLIFGASIIPFLIFKIIFAATSNTYIFSNYSLMFNLALLVVLSLVVLFINLFGRKLEEKDNK